jgi:hypothetical protein
MNPNAQPTHAHTRTTHYTTPRAQYHPLIRAMLKRAKGGSKAELDEVKQASYVLFEATALASGFDIRNPRLFGRQMEKVVRKSLGVALDAKADGPEVIKAEEKPQSFKPPTRERAEEEPMDMGMEEEREVDEEVDEYLRDDNEERVDL